MGTTGGGGLGLEGLEGFRNTGHGVLKRKQSMDSSGHHFPWAIDFPVSLNFRREPAAAEAGETRTVVGEMDFFSDEKKKKSRAEPDHDVKLPSLSIKKEDLTINTGLNLRTANTGSDQSTVDDGMSPNIEENKEGKNELAALQSELGRMNEENQRLRGMLNQLTTNYSALQMHLITLMQQRNQRNGNPQSHEAVDEKTEANKHQESGGAIIPRQFMDLGPAADADEPSHSSTEGGSLDRSSSPQNYTNKAVARMDHEESPDPPPQGWDPNKAPKLTPSKSAEQAQEATMRKARVSVRARSEAPMITDGCQWRKYGQKMAKGNPCPRAYYRCTMATGCPVRKQVQRCADDRSILITTYEGNHNHPLPPAAMAMASTTSAAASMLLSGSMSSNDGLMNSNFLARTILPCSSSMATISASAPFPTVTLDLTTTPNPLQLQRTPAQFQVPFPNGAAGFSAPPQPSSLPQVFSLLNQSKFSGLQLSQEADGAQFLHPKPQSVTPPSLADTVSAATAAITADPNFTAALAAAITSIIGGGAANNTTTTATATATATENNNPSVNKTKSGGNNQPASSTFPAN